MDRCEIVGEPVVGRMVSQGSLEPLSRSVPLGLESSDGYSVAGDHDGLAVLYRVEQASEVPRRMSGGDRYHTYMLSEYLRIYA